MRRARRCERWCENGVCTGARKLCEGETMLREQRDIWRLVPAVAASRVLHSARGERARRRRVEPLRASPSLASRPALALVSRKVQKHSNPSLSTPWEEYQPVYLRRKRIREIEITVQVLTHQITRDDLVCGMIHPFRDAVDSRDVNPVHERGFRARENRLASLGRGSNMRFLGPSSRVLPRGSGRRGPATLFAIFYTGPRRAPLLKRWILRPT